MTRREKVLLGLMSMSIVCATVERSFSDRTLFGSADTQPDEVIRKIRNAATEALGLFKHMALSPQQRHILTHARQPILTDPFILPTSDETGMPASSSLRSRSSSGMPRYTGYIQAGSRRLAIINDIEYAEGDTLPETGDILKSISEQRVILYSPSRKSEWELLYFGDLI